MLKYIIISCFVLLLSTTAESPGGASVVHESRDDPEDIIRRWHSNMSKIDNISFEFSREIISASPASLKSREIGRFSINMDGRDTAFMEMAEDPPANPSRGHRLKWSKERIESVEWVGESSTNYSINSDRTSSIYHKFTQFPCVIDFDKNELTRKFNIKVNKNVSSYTIVLSKVTPDRAKLLDLLDYQHLAFKEIPVEILIEVDKITMLPRSRIVFSGRGSRITDRITKYKNILYK